MKSSLSIEKFKHFIEQHGYTISRYFVFDNQCRFIEILSLRKVESIILYIPENYIFESPRHEQYVFMVSRIQFDDTYTDDVEDYVHVSENIVESNYNMETMFKVPDQHKLSMSQHLDDVYKKNIIVKNLEEQETLLVKDIYRQLRRLKYCIQGAQHKIAILHPPFFGILNFNETIEIYKIDKMKHNNMKRMFIVVEFNVFYDKINVIQEEVHQIFKGIQEVLNTNQKNHVRNIKHLMEKRDDIITQSTRLQKKKDVYTQYASQYCELLDQLYSYYNTTQQEMIEISRFHPNNVHYDMKRSHKKKKLENELKKMEKVKSNLVETIYEVRDKNEHLMLTIDSILFDNIVMLDKIFKNFKQLSKLEKDEK